MEWMEGVEDMNGCDIQVFFSIDHVLIHTYTR